MKCVSDQAGCSDASQGEEESEHESDRSFLTDGSVSDDDGFFHLAVDAQRTHLNAAFTPLSRKRQRQEEEEEEEEEEEVVEEEEEEEKGADFRTPNKRHHHTAMEEEGEEDPAVNLPTPRQRPRSCCLPLAPPLPMSPMPPIYTTHANQADHAACVQYNCFVHNARRRKMRQPASNTRCQLMHQG